MPHDRTLPPRAVDQPAPGCFLLRLVRGGPLVPARIRHGDAGWQAIVDGEARAPDPDPARAADVFRVWHHGEAISEEEFGYREALRLWARAHQADHPAARPRQPIDLHRQRPVFGR